MATQSRPITGVVAQQHEKTTTHVTVVCQRCSKPIKISRSLTSDVLHKQTKMLSPKFDSKKNDEAETSPVFPRKSRLDVFGSLQYEPNMDEIKEIVDDIRQVTDSFSLLSSSGDIDHPLCTVCPEAALEYYQHEIRAEEEAHQRYKALLDDLEEHDQAEVNHLDEDFAHFEEEKDQLSKELTLLHQQSEELSKQLEIEQQREKELSEQEKQYWEEFNVHQQQMLSMKDEQSGLDLQLQYTHDQLSQLKRTSVLNAAFYIWHNGHFATINGLRLGRLSNVPVEWTEINAALGQMTLLLATLEKLCGINFKRYKLIPYGSQSFVQDLEAKKRNLPLHSSSRLFSDAKFDTGMTAFLDCLNQFKQYVEARSNGRFKLPYRIANDKIGDENTMYSVRIQLNSEEHWTKALKFVLTNLRWGVSWVSSNALAEIL